jgi:hypothetical protein
MWNFGTSGNCSVDAINEIYNLIIQPRLWRAIKGGFFIGNIPFIASQ